MKLTDTWTVKLKRMQMVWILIVVQFLSVSLFSAGGLVVCVEADGRVSVERLQDGCCIAKIGDLTIANSTMAERDTDCGDCQDQLLDSHSRLTSRFEATQSDIYFPEQIEFLQSSLEFQFSVSKFCEFQTNSPPRFSELEQVPFPTRC